MSIWIRFKLVWPFRNVSGMKCPFVSGGFHVKPALSKYSLLQDVKVTTIYSIRVRMS